MTERRASLAGRDPAGGGVEDLGTASPLKLRVARILTSDKAGRLIGALSGYRVRHHGLWFDVRSSDFSPQVRAQMFWGAYEGAETRMIRGLLRGSTTVVELGSSLGVTSVHIAALMAPGGHLVCVEANPGLLPGLRELLAERTASLQVDFVHAAVTGHCGDAVLALSPMTVSSRLGAVRPRDVAVGVPALTLREILRRTGVSDFDLVSDIEGAESAFLLEDPDVLRECRRAVIELHDTTVDGRAVSVSDLMEAAVAAGLRIIRRHGPVVSLVRQRLLRPRLLTGTSRLQPSSCARTRPGRTGPSVRRHRPGACLVALGHPAGA
jgi:FkbM family methyltransferase